MDRKYSATCGRIISGERSTVLSHNAVSQCQTDAVPFGLCGKERDKNLLQISRRDSRSRILYLDYCLLYTNKDAPLGLIFGNCLGPVAHQVEQREAQHSVIRVDGHWLTCIDHQLHAQLLKQRRSEEHT